MIPHSKENWTRRTPTENAKVQLGGTECSILAPGFSLIAKLSGRACAVLFEENDPRGAYHVLSGCDGETKTELGSEGCVSLTLDAWSAANRCWSHSTLIDCQP
jgi:hypothetical protein